jgi:sec-independent protein translocase protein TatA
MFSGSEWIWIVIIALVLFGGSQIPKLARNLGQAQTEFKKGLSSSEDDSDSESSEKDTSESTKE